VSRSNAVNDQERVFEAVLYLQPEFSRPTWFGFSNSGKPGAVFYVDNIRVENRSGRTQ